MSTTTTPTAGSVTPANVVGSGTQVVGNQPITVDGESLDHKLSKLATKVLTYFITGLLIAIAGALFAIVYDLNGKIYEAVGKQSANKQITDFEIRQLQKENLELNSENHRLKCLNDSQIKNKGDCYK